MKVVLVDHEIYRLGLRLILDPVPGCEVVGEACTALAALELIAQLGPDVVVIDPALRSVGGASAIRMIRRCSPGVRILVLTELGHERDVAAAMAEGATGYALKGEDNDAILRALRQVHRRRLYLTPGLGHRREPRLGFVHVMASR
jgi:two-component system nitrate/nitrite response regulator NarL